MFKFNRKKLILISLIFIFIKIIRSESKILGTACNWNKIPIECIPNEHFFAYRNEIFQQKLQLIFDITSKDNFFSQNLINLDINDSIDATRVDIVFKIHNVTNLKLDLFFIPQFFIKNYYKNITTIDKIKILNFAPKTKIFIHKDFLASLNCTNFEIINSNKNFSLQIFLKSVFGIKTNRVKELILDNIEFFRLPTFYFPFLQLFYLNSVNYLSTNNSMFELKCNSPNFKTIFQVNQNISLISNGEKCLNSKTILNKCDSHSSQVSNLQHKREIFDYDTSENNLSFKILNLNKLYQHFSNDLIIFITVFSIILLIYITLGISYFKNKIKHKKSKSRTSVNSFRTSLDSEVSINRRSIQRHQFAVENLKKRPSKSILITPERKSQILENRLSALKIGFEQNRESLSSQNRLSVIGSRQSQVSASSNRYSITDGSTLGENDANRLSNFNLDENRKSLSSLKSVTFNEKTQVRRVKKVRLN